MGSENRVMRSKKPEIEIVWDKFEKANGVKAGRGCWVGRGVEIWESRSRHVSISTASGYFSVAQIF